MFEKQNMFAVVGKNNIHLHFSNSINTIKALVLPRDSWVAAVATCEAKDDLSSLFHKKMKHEPSIMYSLNHMNVICTSFWRSCEEA